MTDSKKSNWFAFTQPNPDARLRLFCLPHAGGGASVYRQWLRRLPKGIDVCPVQLPGRENRVMDPPIDNMARMLEALDETLAPFMDRPFAFFGHSMGGLISFEFARRLREQKRPAPAHLFISGHQSPPRPNKLPPMSHLPDDEFLSELRRLEYTPQAVFEHEELISLLLPALKGDFTLFENYNYTEKPPLDCAVTCFAGRQDKLVDKEDVEAWREHTRGNFDTIFFDGDHFFLNQFHNEIIEAVSKKLSACLSSSQPSL